MWETGGVGLQEQSWESQRDPGPRPMRKGPEEKRMGRVGESGQSWSMTQPLLSTRHTKYTGCMQEVLTQCEC